AIGLSAGIGAVELAAVISMALNYTFAILWLTEYGEREGMKRYLADYDGNDIAVRKAEKVKAEKPADPAYAAQRFRTLALGSSSLAMSLKTPLRKLVARCSVRGSSPGVC